MSLAEIRFQQLNVFGKLPTRAYDSAGYDLYAADYVYLRPGETKTVGLGIAAEWTPDHVVLFRDRSSMGKAGITVFAGVIDADYRGEWCVTLHNVNPRDVWLRRLWVWLTSQTEPGGLEIHIGQRVAQALVLPIAHPECKWCLQLAPSRRGQAGYGSSGGSPAERLNHVP